MNTYTIPSSYETSRQQFREYSDILENMGWRPQRLEYPLPDQPNLTIDVVYCPAVKRPENLFTYSLGEHGIEAYFGAVVLQQLLQEFIPKFDPDKCGLLLVHAVNPWGMKHHRRVNYNNVDLNRNFILDPAQFDQLKRLPTPQLSTYINPQKPVGDIFTSRIGLWINLIASLVTVGRQAVYQSTIGGQYSNPHHLYFGGDRLQPESQVLLELFGTYYPLFRKVTHIDCHTGYGPSDRMTVVCSGQEPESSIDLSQLFHYPLVVKANPKEFYSMLGDLIDTEYELVGRKVPGLDHFAAAFEFGTNGDSTAAVIEDLHITLLENQLTWYGSKNKAIEERVRNDFSELYCPKGENWKEKALADARQAFQGIFTSRGFIQPD